MRLVVADKLVYCHEALALHAKLHRMLLTSQSLSPGMRIQMRIQTASDEKDEEAEILRLTV